MPGIRVLRNIQLGQETVKGTAVVATARWRGIGTIDDQLELVFPREDTGNIPGRTRTYIPKLFAEMPFDAVEATYEQLGYILAAGVKDVTAGIADGAGTDFIYTYDFPKGAVNAIQTYTIEAGDDQQVEEIEYCFVTSFTLSGAAGEAVMMEATFAGRQSTPVTLTAALALPAVEDILFQLGKLFIDPIGGTIGATQVSNSLLAFELVVTTGLVPVWTADGALTFSFEKMSEPEVVLTITFEHDSSSVAEKLNWRNETPRLVRVQFEGSDFGTPGTDFTKHTLQLDFAGQWEKFDAIDEQDGNDIVVGTFRAKDDATASLFAQILIANEIATLV